MAKIIKKAKKIRKKSKRNTSQAKVQNGVFSKIKFTESYTSLILGAIMVLIVGILFIFFAKGNRNMQTSSIKDISEIENQNSNTSSTYTIKPGDDLWSISENIYKDGFKWTEIAKINNIENPGLIYAGNKLTIPTITPTTRENSVEQKLDQTPQKQKSVTQNNSITGDTYAVIKGDNLWNIAVRAYGDGFRWPEIAKANNLINPSLIHPGNVFKIPR